MNNMVKEDLSLLYFLNSEKDEIEYYNIDIDKDKLITASEFLKSYKSDYQKSFNEIETMVILISKKNPWIKDIHIDCGKKAISFNDTYLWLNNQGKIINVKDNIKDNLKDILYLLKLTHNSKEELICIFSSLEELFNKYKNTMSISNRFYISCIDKEENLNLSPTYTNLALKRDIYNSVNKDNLKKRVYVRKP